MEVNFTVIGLHGMLARKDAGSGNKLPVKKRDLEVDQPTTAIAASFSQISSALPSRAATRLCWSWAR